MVPFEKERYHRQDRHGTDPSVLQMDVSQEIMVALASNLAGLCEISEIIDDDRLQSIVDYNQSITIDRRRGVINRSEKNSYRYARLVIAKVTPLKFK